MYLKFYWKLTATLDMVLDKPHNMFNEIQKLQ